MNLNRLQKGIAHRKNPYEIETELKVRKELEIRTGYKREFKRNDDQYQEDIECYRYELYGNDWNRSLLGYVEVEEKPKWRNGVWPSYYHSYRFLARKVLQYNYNHQFFTDKYKDNADRTIYLCTAIDLSDAFCILTSDIPDAGTFWTANSQYHNRTDCYFEVPLNSPYVQRGWDNCAKFIIDFLK